MAATHLKGPLVVDGTNISATEIGYLDGVTAGTATASKAVVLDASKGITTITSATITTLTSTTGNVTTVNATDVNAGASGTAGTVDVFPSTASKGKIQIAAVDNTNNDTLTITNAAQAAARTYTLGDVGASAGFAMLAATPTATIGSTPAEIDRQCDISLQTETIAEGGVVSVTKRYTKIVSTGAGAITIAAPDASSLGQVKVIEMTGGEHDVTLALTNCQGQSSGTTATFSDINDTLVLVAGTLKWNVVGEAGIALS